MVRVVRPLLFWATRPTKHLFRKLHDHALAGNLAGVGFCVPQTPFSEQMTRWASAPKWYRNPFITACISPWTSTINSKIDSNQIQTCNIYIYMWFKIIHPKHIHPKKTWFPNQKPCRNHQFWIELVAPSWCPSFQPSIPHPAVEASRAQFPAQLKGTTTSAGPRAAPDTWQC